MSKKNKTKVFLNEVTRFLKDESGQSTTEYILILAVVVMIAMKFKKTFNSSLDGITSSVFGKINEAVNE